MCSDHGVPAPGLSVDGASNLYLEPRNPQRIPAPLVEPRISASLLTAESMTSVTDSATPPPMQQRASRTSVEAGTVLMMVRGLGMVYSFASFKRVFQSDHGAGIALGCRGADFVESVFVLTGTRQQRQ